NSDVIQAQGLNSQHVSCISRPGGLNSPVTRDLWPLAAETAKEPTPTPAVLLARADATIQSLPAPSRNRRAIAAFFVGRHQAQAFNREHGNESAQNGPSHGIWRQQFAA